MKHAVLKFSREALLYDIRNMAYVEGDIMESTDEHRRHQVTDICEEGNIDRVTRVLNRSHALCVELLYPLSRHEVLVSEHGNAWSNALTERDEYRIDLFLPDTFSQTTVNLIEELAHEYMTCKALADWLSVTKSDKAEVWETKASSAANEIARAKHNRIGAMTRKCSVF